MILPTLLWEIRWIQIYATKATGLSTSRLADWLHRRLNRHPAVSVVNRGDGAFGGWRWDEMTAPQARRGRVAARRLMVAGLVAGTVTAVLFVAGRLHQPDYAFSMFGADPFRPKSLLASIAGPGRRPGAARAVAVPAAAVGPQPASGRAHRAPGGRSGAVVLQRPSAPPLLTNATPAVLPAADSLEGRSVTPPQISGGAPQISRGCARSIDPLGPIPAW